MDTSTAAGATERTTLLRNRPAARRLHATVYLLTAFLAFSGVAVSGEGRPSLEDLLGGHETTAASHRWIGFLLIGVLLLVAAVRPVAIGRFIAESVRIRAREINWFKTWPRFVLRPRRNAPSRHEGHFDPGQRAFNLVVVVSFLALAVSGVVMSLPERFTQKAFAVSFDVHVVATVVLVVAVAGHIAIASGVLNAYRGVGRAMHLGGWVRADLARRLWPRWAEAQERDAPLLRVRTSAHGDTDQPTDREGGDGGRGADQ